VEIEDSLRLFRPDYGSMQCLHSKLALFGAVILLALFSNLLLPCWVPVAADRRIEAQTSPGPTASEQFNLTLSIAVDINAIPQGTEIAVTGRVAFSNGTGIISEVSIEVRNPYGSTVGLRLAPTDLTGTFSDTFIIPSDSPAGAYSIDVTGCRGTVCIARSTSFALSPSDFSIDVAPENATLQQGGTAIFKITLLPFSKFNSTVTVTLLDAPNGTSYSFSQTSMLPRSSTQLSIATSATAPVGTFTAVIVAEGGGREHSETITLTIRPASASNEWIVLVVFVLVICAVLGLTFWRRRHASEEFRLEEDKDSLAVVRALARLEELKATGKVSSEEYEKLRKEYDHRLEKFRKQNPR
jgi:hypothetical protein